MRTIDAMIYDIFCMLYDDVSGFLPSDKKAVYLKKLNSLKKEIQLEGKK